VRLYHLASDLADELAKGEAIFHTAHVEHNPSCLLSLGGRTYKEDILKGMQNHL
jgi:hypothetical protein